MKKVIFLVVRIAVSVALIAYVVSLINFKDKPNEPGLITIISEANKLYLIPFFLLVSVPIILDGFRWKILLEAGGEKCNVFDAIRLTFIGAFFNTFLLGLTGGDIVKAYFISKTHEKKVTSYISAFLDRILGLVALSVLAMIIVSLNIYKKEFVKPAFIIFGFFFACVLFYFIYFFRWIRGLSIVQKIKKILPFKNVLKDIDEVMHIYKNKKGAIAIVLCICLIGHLVGIVVNVGYGKAIGIDIATISYFVYFPVIIMLQALPISIGGIGVGEGAYVYFFGMSGVSSTQAITLAILIRLTFILWGLVGGILLLLGGEKVKNEKTT